MENVRGKRRISFCFAVMLLVPEVGLEPTLPGGNRILSPARLPIPPLRQAGENRDYSMGHTHDRFVDKEKRAWR